MKLYTDFERAELEDLLLLIDGFKLDASYLKSKIDKMLEFHRWQDGLLFEAVNKQMEQIIDRGLSVDQTRQLLGEFWTSLKPETKKAGDFSKKVNQWFKDNEIELIELCKG